MDSKSKSLSLILIITMSKIILLFIILDTVYFTVSGKDYVPIEFFGNEAFSDPKVLVLLIVGGLLVGFGARYAGGCTSGHSISGISNLLLPSLIATIGFLVGVFFLIHLICPLIIYYNTTV